MPSNAASSAIPQLNLLTLSLAKKCNYLTFAIGQHASSDIDVVISGYPTVFRKSKWEGCLKKSHRPAMRVTSRRRFAFEHGAWEHWRRW
jgi:hypothetical protein